MLRNPWRDWSGIRIWKVLTRHTCLSRSAVTACWRLEHAMRDARYRVISARRAREHEEAECRKQIEREATERSRG
jgi:hypothetical protein